MIELFFGLGGGSHAREASDDILQAARVQRGGQCGYHTIHWICFDDGRRDAREHILAGGLLGFERTVDGRGSGVLNSSSRGRFDDLHLWVALQQADQVFLLLVSDLGVAAVVSTCFQV